MDLSQALWLKSPSTESWLERRTNFTRSVALMSMVGYILGLGDRHPQNLMLQRYTGDVVHIDFGDCFEVAQHRDKFPEKVPFRLTHILQNALEVSGIEGTFRDCCENVMNLARKNGDQILGLLEVFIYDPLLQWIDQNQSNSNNTNENNQNNNENNENNENSENNNENNEKKEKEEESPSAVAIIKRIQDKFEGNDFVAVNPELKELDVKTQVDLLIKEFD